MVGIRADSPIVLGWRASDVCKQERQPATVPRRAGSACCNNGRAAGDTPRVRHDKLIRRFNVCSGRQGGC